MQTANPVDSKFGSSYPGIISKFFLSCASIVVMIENCPFLGPQIPLLGFSGKLSWWSQILMEMNYFIFDNKS